MFIIFSLSNTVGFFGLNTDLEIDANSIPYPNFVLNSTLCNGTGSEMEFSFKLISGTLHLVEG